MAPAENEQRKGVVKLGFSREARSKRIGGEVGLKRRGSGGRERIPEWARRNARGWSSWAFLGRRAAPRIGADPRIGMVPSIGAAPRIGAAPSIGAVPGIGAVPRIGTAPAQRQPYPCPRRPPTSASGEGKQASPPP